MEQPIFTMLQIWEVSFVPAWPFDACSHRTAHFEVVEHDPDEGNGRSTTLGILQLTELTVHFALEDPR